MTHTNIDITSFLELLKLVGKPNKRSDMHIKVAKGYYKLKKKRFKIKLFR